MEKLRVTDPSVIGEGRGTPGLGKENRPREKGRRMWRDPREPPKERGHGREGGRRTRGPGSKVKEARKMPGNQGLPENERDG